MAAPTIHTYHCICTSLLLASTHILTSLPRRAPPSLDSAIMVPLPPAPTTLLTSSPPSDSGGDSGEDEAHDIESGTSNADRLQESTPELPELGYTLLLSTTLDHRPTMIRRSDGFEKRYMLRCGRCRLVVGYELDESHYATSNTGEATPMDVDTEAGRGSKDKERTKIAYLLPGGILSTEAMIEGKKISDQDVALGEVERTVVAAWE